MYFLGSEWIIRVLLHLWLNVFCTGWPTTAPADESSMILVAADRSDFVTSTAWPPEVAARSWYSWKSDLVIGEARWPWGLLASRRLGSVSKKVTWSVNGEMELQKKIKIKNSPGRLCVSLGLFKINDNAHRNFIPQILCFLSGRWLYFSDESPWQVHPWRQRSQRRGEQQSRPAINHQDRQEILVWLAIGIHRLLPSFCRSTSKIEKV